MGDDSQPSWEEAPEWQKESAIKGVALHIEGHITGEPVSPEASHQAWMEEKVNDGWVYGPEKNTELKTHPCMVPYNDLPAEQRAKDHLFAAVIRELMQL
jgi:hypothetical protein